jgi:hypothetical protein
MIRIATGIALAALTGCAIDDGNTDQSTGETRQAVSSFGIWSWGCSSGSCQITLGPASGETCFLAGVWGNLQHAGAFSSVEVIQSGGNWGLQVVHNGQPLGGTAVCIPGNPTAPPTLWFSGEGDVSIGTGGATERCFLTGVRNNNGFTSNNDFVQVHKLRSGWALGGNMGSDKSVEAHAICVNVPSATGDLGMVAVDGDSLLNRPIVSNNPGGWACGLKKLGGHFVASDYNDGVWIDYNNGSTNGGNPEWELNGVNGKQATTYCVK